MFSTQDVKFMDEFGAMLTEVVRFDGLSINKLLAVHDMLAKYNELRNKINDHVCELKLVKEAPNADSVQPGG